MFTSYNFPKLENCIDKQLSQIGNISLVGDRALRAFLARAPRLADPPGDHDGWEKVVACCSCCPVAGTRVGDRFASGASIGRDGCPPPIPEDGLPVLRADFGVREGVLRRIGEALSRRTTVAAAQAHAMAGANGHVIPRGPSPE